MENYTKLTLPAVRFLIDRLTHLGVKGEPNLPI